MQGACQPQPHRAGAMHKPCMECYSWEAKPEPMLSVCEDECFVAIQIFNNICPRRHDFYYITSHGRRMDRDLSARQYTYDARYIPDTRLPYQPMPSGQRTSQWPDQVKSRQTGPDDTITLLPAALGPRA